MSQGISRSPAIVGLLLLLAPLALALTGCPKPKAAKTTPREVERQDALAAVRDTLRREPQLKDCQTAVAQLNIYLSRTDESRPAPLSTAERDLLTSKLRLTDTEIKEVGQESFTTLDTHYLEEALLFHDAIRSLNLNFADKSAAGTLERARLALAWAMRQVWPLEQPGRPLAAAAVLRFGFGSATERLGVALAALQQAGVDAGLVGHARDERSLRVWAIGVPAGAEVHLFDARSGRPIAAADGKGSATLKQVRAAPDLVKAQVEAVETGADVKAVVAATRVYLSPPLSALAPRMRWFQGVLAATPPTVLGVDPLELRDRFTKAGERPEFWNPPADPTSLTRRLTGALPQSEGGSEAKDAAARNAARAHAVLVPLDQAPAPLLPDRATGRSRITGEPQERMLRLFSSRFIELAAESGKPRDLLLRGQFDEATKALADALARTAQMQQRVGGDQNLEKGALAWVDDMLTAEATLSRLRERPNTSPSELSAAQARVDFLNKNASKVVLLIEQSVSEPYAAALTYQMALCIHEQAERRARDRSPAAAKRDSWQSAAGWWDNYLTRYAAAPWAKRGQIDHARQLQAEVRRELAALPQ